jgi:hypothetical protein
VDIQAAPAPIRNAAFMLSDWVQSLKCPFIRLAVNSRAIC